MVLTVPGTFGADVDALTEEGVIRMDGSLGAGAAAEGDRRALRATIGTGGRVLRIRTNDGTVTIRKS